MVHCPDCRSPISSAADVAFEETDARTGVLRASKRFYTANCAECGATLGSGVAGARGNGGGAV